MTEEEKTKSRKGVSRREFITGTVGGVVVGAVVGAAAGSLGFPKTVTQTQTTTQTTTATTTAQPWLPAKWDQTADVVVVGYGLGAMVAAIEANAAGAKVLMLEKAPQEKRGGTCRVCGQLLSMPTPDLQDKYYQYHTNQDFEHLSSDAVHKAIAAEMVKVEPYILSLGGTTVPTSYAGIWNVPGNEANIWKNVAPAGTSNGWNFFDKIIQSKGIQVLFSTPATSLVANPAGEVLGVVAQNAGTTLYIKASRGVVLGTGGYENNPDMMINSSIGAPLVPSGTPYDTGDGVTMAAAVGAKIVQMNNIIAPHFGCIKAPGFDSGFRIGFGASSYIFVDKFGARFANESKPETYGYDWHQILIFERARMTFPTIPWYAIFDQAVMDKAPLMNSSTMGWNPVVEGYKWSSNNQAELAKGWVQQGASLDEVASKIAALPGDEGKMSAATLKATMDAYSQAVSAKNDTLFGRPTTTLAPIAGPPYYFVEVWPVVHSTGGGPQRDENGRIVSLKGGPVPRLYSVGELGASWGSGYNGGFIEGIPSGRIAGRNVTAETPWT